MAFEPMIIIGLKLAYLVKIMLKMGVFEKSKTYIYIYFLSLAVNAITVKKKVQNNKL